MGCNCGGSAARAQRGSTGAGNGSLRQQPGFWAPPTKEAAAAPVKTPKQ